MRWVDNHCHLDPGPQAADAVAQAAEATHPEEALGLYLGLVERLIQWQGRENYAAAARYLQRVRTLYQGQGQAEQWQALITSVRTENKRLRALKDELDKAKL